MRYVNCADDEEWQTMAAFQYMGKIYYKTYKPVLPYTEILIWYGDDYASKLGIELKGRKYLPPPKEIQSTLQAYTSNINSLKARFQFSGSKPNTTSWIFEAPAPDLAKLIQVKKIPLRWQMFQISKFYHIKRCNFCQAFGHTTKDCHFNIPSCAAHHPTKDCKSNFLFCVNCFSKNNFELTNPSAYHSTKDKSCPCFLQEIDIYKKSRDYIPQ
ncbi:hypothetical protein AVEN_71885-1 [Araneus ventricosus]|uniref:SET domain-containing protein n=1 Tax=Araneus ventricosus TaxID=182803 RepID=A0A4Y2VCA3_ARAVE|nr:hypothetical protein AVEN_71885-1 [Araneus ventricosus]